jgi:signal transduction histidine kinase
MAGAAANHEDLAFIAAEQAALRRVATLVARGARDEQVFDAVCEETGRLIGATNVNLARFTADGINHTIAGWSQRGNHVPPGTRLPLDGYTINVLIQSTRRPSRVDTYEGAPGELAAMLRTLGIRSEVGAPVIVNGDVWGGLIAGSDQVDGMPAGTEDRVASFAELIATAVANAAVRAELVASRARVVAASDAARRRLARDIHDGAQQRLVTAVIDLELADEALGRNPDNARQLLREAISHAREGLDELRTLAAGVHPAILTTDGLAAATRSLASRLPLGIHVDIPSERFHPDRELAAYFVVAEALTNAVKHSHASHILVRGTLHDGRIRLEVADNGAGGANPEGHGLLGLRDRVEALDGRFHIDSHPGRGTSVTMELATADR